MLWRLKQMKIISLQSVGLGAYEQDGITGNMSPTPMVKMIGFPFDTNPYGPTSEDTPKVVSIELAIDSMLPRNTTDDGWIGYSDLYYKVTTSDGHIRLLPEQSYIAEWVDDDEN